MQLLILIPALLIFLYSLYKLSGDDHVLIRKNISLEQMFDIAFNTLWISLLLSRLYYFLFDQKITGNLFIAFFSTAGGLSLPGAVVGGIAALYFLGRYKRMPLGRLFDFVTLSLLFAFPAGFIGIALLHLKQPAVITAYGVSALLYLIIAILFRKFLYPRLLNRTVKEGNMSIYFLFLFPLISFLVSLIHFGKSTLNFVTINNFVFLALFFLAFVLFIKQEKGKLRRRA
jgi:prolipoprotein diacylglyceryltransferase